MIILASTYLLWSFCTAPTPQGASSVYLQRNQYLVRAAIQKVDPEGDFAVVKKAELSITQVIAGLAGLKNKCFVVESFNERNIGYRNFARISDKNNEVGPIGIGSGHSPELCFPVMEQTTNIGENMAEVGRSMDQVR